MPKKQKIRYNYSGQWEDVKRLLRMFSTKEVLARVNCESAKLIQTAGSSDMSAVESVFYTVYGANGMIPQKKQSMITAWNLIDLAYYMIIASDDYRGRAIESNEEFYVLVDSVEGLKQRKEEEMLKEVDAGSPDFFMYLWGFAGEQFKLELPGRIFDNAGRELYILFESEKKTGEPFESIESIIAAETGYSWAQIVTALLMGWFMFFQNSEYKDDYFDFREEILSADDIFNILMRYAADYNSVRTSSLGRQFLYTKPYVITQNNKLVSISAYLNLFIYEHCILWIVRDYYQKKGDRAFTSYFGKCFEKYFEELLQTYLNKNEFEKIPETKAERADWKIVVEGYQFLVEQKSTIIRLGAKQQESNIEAIRAFAKGTVLKAVKQLYNTEKDFDNGKYVKIVLLYDDYLKPEIMDQFLSLPECKVESDNYYWLMSIEEAEMLFSLCKSKREVFRKIVGEKIEREITHSIAGKSIGQLLSENKIVKNEYLHQDKIWKYREFAQNNIRKILHGE